MSATVAKESPVRLSDLLRGATVKRAEWIGELGERTDITQMMSEAVTVAQPGMYARAATGADVRSSLLKAFGQFAPEHPSLRWQVNGTLLGCRREDDHRTVCGRRGMLTVATDAGIPPCPKCCPGE